MKDFAQGSKLASLGSKVNEWEHRIELICPVDDFNLLASHLHKSSPKKHKRTILALQKHLRIVRRSKKKINGLLKFEQRVHISKISNNKNVIKLLKYQSNQGGSSDYLCRKAKGNLM